MKIALKTLIVTLLLSITQAAIALDNIIYIVEPVIEKDLETAKTLISTFKPDGTETKRVLVSGVLARVSPNGKYIVYAEKSIEEPWKIVLADANGKKIKNLLESGKRKKGIVYSEPTNLIWSPDEEKIVVVKRVPTGTAVTIVNLKTKEAKNIYSGRINSSHEVYFYTANWFPDSKRLLIAGTNGTRIINTETKEEKLISESVIAYFSGDGKKIIHIPQFKEMLLNRSGKSTPSFEVYQYDTEKEKNDLVMILIDVPLMAVITQDGKYLAFQDMTAKESAISIIDLINKKVLKVDTKDKIMLLKKFSPFTNDLVICIGFQKDEKTLQYGILNLKNGDFHVFKKSSSWELHGKEGFIFFMGFDWYDWR